MKDTINAVRCSRWACHKWTYVVPQVTRDYWQLVMVTLAHVPAGMYGMDDKRAGLHASLCAHYGLTHEQSKEVTDHMDRIEHGAEGFHYALQDLWDKCPQSGSGEPVRCEGEGERK